MNKLYAYIAMTTIATMCACNNATHKDSMIENKTVETEIVDPEAVEVAAPQLVETVQAAEPAEPADE